MTQIRRINLFVPYSDEQLERLAEISRRYPDGMTTRGRGTGYSGGIRRAIDILLAMSDAEIDQHLGGGQFRPVDE